MGRLCRGVQLLLRKLREILLLREKASAFFLSHSLRDDVVIHLIFYGAPDPPKHIEIHVNEETKVSKKDVANLIKKILYKYRPGQKTEAVSGCFVEKKSFLDVIKEITKEGKEIFILSIEASTFFHDSKSNEER